MKLLTFGAKSQFQQCAANRCRMAPHFSLHFQIVAFRFSESLQSSRTSTVCYLGCVSMWTGKWVWVFHHSSMFLHVGECMGKCVDECVGECMGECAGECVGECVLHFVYLNVWMGVSSPVWRRIWICQCVSPVVCDMARVPLPLFVSVSESATSPHHLIIIIFFFFIFIIFIISWSYDLMISWSYDRNISSSQHLIISTSHHVNISSSHHLMISWSSW